ncbi:ATP-binding protein [Candidatus Heimdallarchaeota archaeon B3_Heim]|nr:MAG: ATP-binding protein [Candidatus Heimdallarchaeota archaeon B3_Heim]
MEIKQHLEQNMKRLKMPGMMYNLELRLQEARENQLGHLEFLSLLFQDELLNREGNNFQKRIKAAGFGVIKTFEGFDFNFNEEAFSSSLIRDLATCHFWEQRRNLVLCGPSGIGKSHIAKAIGHEICRRGENVLFKKTGKLLQELMKLPHSGRAERLFRKCVKAGLLILDDFAFRKFDQKESELLYGLADERLGRASTILTSNRPPQDWYGIFPDPVIGQAILDRLVSGAVKVITTKGKSYRKEGKFGIE